MASRLILGSWWEVDGTDGEFQGEREKRKPGLESAVNVNAMIGSRAPLVINAKSSEYRNYREKLISRFWNYKQARFGTEESSSSRRTILRQEYPSSQISSGMERTYCSRCY